MTMSAETAGTDAREAGAARPDQFLTFTLGSEVYALDITRVREVLDFTTLTRVPRMPDFLRGVINLRGSVVPVVDLRLKFGMQATEKSIDTCVIITEVAVDGQQTVLGALADSVREVIELDAAGIAPAPRIGTTLHTEFITGIGTHDGRFVTILDIERVFEQGELASVTAAA